MKFTVTVVIIGIVCSKTQGTGEEGFLWLSLTCISYSFLAWCRNPVAFKYLEK